MTDRVETHPLSPFIVEDARILMCGTFPPARDKWSMDFFYPNFINDMWRIFGIVFKSNKDYYVDIKNKTFKLDKIKDTLTEHRIAVSDTAFEIRRLKGNASDKFLEIITPVNLKQIMRSLKDCQYIVTTGEKAASVIASITDSELPDIGNFTESDFMIEENEIRKIRHYRMPSSSRAYPMKLEKKATIYYEVFQQIGII